MSASFEYLIQCPVTDRRAGRVLAGWPVDGGGKSPRLSAIPGYDTSSPHHNATYKRIMDLWGVELFGARGQALSSELRSLLLATLLLRHRSYVIEYGTDNPVVSSMLTAAASYGMTDQHLMNAADAVNADFLQQNARYLPMKELGQASDPVLIDAKTLAGALHTMANSLQSMSDRLAKLESVGSRGHTYFTPDRSATRATPGPNGHLV